MENLLNSIHKVNKQFPENWRENIYDELIIEEKKTLWIGNVSSTANKVIFLWMKSILAGEYMHENYITEMKRFLDILKSTTLDDKLDDPFFQKIDLNLRRLLLEPFQSFFSIYINEVRNEINARIENKPIIVFSSNFDYWYSHFKKNEEFKINLNYLDLFEIIIMIIRIEFNLQVSRDKNDNLLLLLYKLDKLKNEDDDFNTLKLILSEKVNFLASKLSKRFVKRNEIPEYYMGDVIYGISDDKDDTYLVQDLQKWNKYIDFHYSSDDDYQTKVQKNLRSKGTESIKTFDNCVKFHSKIKELKDFRMHSNSIGSIKTLIKEFKNFKKNKIKVPNDFDLLQRFNNKSYHLNFLYLLNNQFSYLIEKKYNKEIIDEYFEKIESYQIEKNIPNFFVFKKRAEFLRELISNKINSKNLVGLDNLLVELNSQIKKWMQNLKLCRNINYIPYQLAFHESIIEYKGFKVFCPTSFVVPIDFEEHKNHIEEARISYHSLKTIFKTQLALKDDMRIIVENRKKIENSEKKNIEILSIFSAIVLFTISEINILSNDKLSEIQILKLSLIFAYSLGIFSMLIWLITRNHQVKKFKDLSIIHWGILSILLLATVFIIITIYYPK